MSLWLTFHADSPNQRFQKFRAGVIPFNPSVHNRTPKAELVTFSSLEVICSSRSWGMGIKRLINRFCTRFDTTFIHYSLWLRGNAQKFQNRGTISSYNWWSCETCEQKNELNEFNKLWALIKIKTRWNWEKNEMYAIWNKWNPKYGGIKVWFLEGGANWFKIFTEIWRHAG